MSDQPVKKLSDLSRLHAVKATTNARTEDFALALGAVVGHKSVLSASRMCKVCVGFVDSLSKAEELIKKGIVINGKPLALSPLSTPAKRVTISNAPPYLEDEVLAQTLSRYGEIVTPFEVIPISATSPLVQHVASFRRAVYMVLPRRELEVTLRFEYENMPYNVYVTTGKMRCFGCGATSHRIRTCPRNPPDTPATPRVTPAPSGESAAQVKEAVKETVEEMLTQMEQEEESRAPPAPLELSEPMETLTEQESSCRKKISAKRKVKHQEEPSEEPSCSDTPAKKKVELQAPEKKGSSRRRRSAAADATDTDSDCDSRVEYSVEDIKYFLRITKNSRGVEIFNYFTDEKVFVQKCKELMAQNSFEDTEVYRLKKFCKKVNDHYRIENG